jgi:hypothetical protein
MVVRKPLAAVAVLLGLCVSAHAGVFGAFEGGTAPGFGALTNSGIQPWQPPVSGAVTTGSVGSFSGSKVLELSGTAAFNFGQSGGAALGFDFLSQNLRNDFLANSAIEFDWLAAPIGSTSGYNELFNIILNSQGGGFTNVAGTNGFNTPNTSQFYFNGYNGNVLHVVVDYTNYKNTILASGFPNGGGWLQLGIQPNAGGYSGGMTTATYQFDNFALTPEPGSVALICIAGVGMLARRRRSA